MSSNYHSSWVYLSNPFYNRTSRSYKQFFNLSSDHIASLEQAKDDQRIKHLASIYRPLHDAFAEVYEQTDQERDVWQGMTLEVSRKEEELVQMIGKWDVRLQTVFYQDTVAYKTLLPNKRGPFQNNTREQRLYTLKTFANKLKTYPQLTDLQKDVQAFYDEFNGLREQQQQQETTVTRTTEQLKAAHIEAAEQMYKNLGMLIFIFGTSYELTAFFKLSIIRKHISKAGKGSEMELVQDVEGENGLVPAEEGAEGLLISDADLDVDG